MTTNATIPTLSGEASFSAYVAQPDGEAKAAVIVIQEIFGVNAGIRRKC
ncbi:MAG: dienelactone hydrolase family protein, partial [Tsuneonella sp.]